MYKVTPDGVKSDWLCLQGACPQMVGDHTWSHGAMVVYLLAIWGLRVQGSVRGHLTDPPGHFLRDKWTTLSGPLSFWAVQSTGAGLASPKGFKFLVLSHLILSRHIAHPPPPFHR